MVGPRAHLDFLHPSGRGSRFGPLLLAAGILALIGAASYQRQVAERVAASEQRIEEVRAMAQRSRPALQAEEADTPEVREQIKQANTVLQQMNMPWGELFTAVEAAQDADVALLRVQPDARNQTIMLAGEARGLTAVLGYMGRLESSERLLDVVLVSHELKADEPGQPVAFVLQAQWEEAQ